MKPIAHLLRQRLFAVLGLLTLLALITACTMNNLPRNMRLKAFQPHRPAFTCVHESAKLSAITPEAERLFQQGMVLTRYDLWPEQRDYAKAAELWRQAAAQGHWKAALNLAGLYERGWGVTRDTEQAVKIVEGLMTQGVPAAFDRMGTYHQDGMGVKGDVDRAYAFWQLAADMGNPAAQTYLGRLLKGTYNDPKAGIWANRAVSFKMLECGFAQGWGDAAYELGVMLNGGNASLGQDYGRALKVFHEGVKMGSKECASNLFVSFGHITPMTGNVFDKLRAKRYFVLFEALELNPDLRFPNLDKVLPLPPADLPFWDGKRETLIDAAKGLVPAKVLLRTPGSEHTGRAHIPDGWLLPDEDSPSPLQEETVGRPSIYPHREQSEVKFTGYWLPQLRDEYSERDQRWNAAQLPRRYARGERFESVRASLGSDKGFIQWHFMGVPYRRPAPEIHPMVAQRIARSARVPQPQQVCRGSLACPRTGTWVGHVDQAHPGASAFNLTGRQAYLQKGDAFPDPDGLHLGIVRRDVTWLWLDNANQVDAQGFAHVTLSDLHDTQGKPIA